MVKFVCPSCPLVYEVAEGDVGKTARCACGAVFEVPAPSQLIQKGVEVKRPHMLRGSSVGKPQLVEALAKANAAEADDPAHEPSHLRFRPLPTPGSVASPPSTPFPKFSAPSRQPSPVVARLKKQRSQRLAIAHDFRTAAGA